MRFLTINDAGFPVVFGFLMLPVLKFSIFNKSSSTTVQETKNFNTTIAADSGGIAVESARSVSVDLPAEELFVEATDFAGQAFESTLETLGQSFSDVLGLVKGEQARGERIAMETLDVAGSVQEKDSTEISKLVLYGGVIVGVVVLAPFVIKAFR